MSLLDRLDQWHADRPDKVAYRLLGDGETETARLTYRELHEAVARVAGRVLTHCGAGDRVALLFKPSLEFVVAFLGVLRADCVPVPVAAPASHGASTVGLNTILADADPALLLTDFPADTVAGWVSGDHPVEHLPVSGGAAATFPPVTTELALLQYTSGSTGSPRGVMVSHRNMTANQEQMRLLFGQGDDAVVVSWLPFFHDMGLIGGVLHPLYLGATAILMPPESFLRKPVRWLRAISSYRGTISPAPNFGYDLCARRVTDTEGLDLSSWLVACNGSEPVRAQVLADFEKAFAPSGFRAESFVPCYGLAEATLLVSGSVGRRPRVEPHVSCGSAVADLVIVRDGVAQPDGAEGEIWVHGPNVADGYWRKPEASAETFQARLPGDERSFLRTGDLGIVLDGEVAVTGRLKDVLIIRGRNHYPQDVEATVQAVDPRLVRGSGAAFTVDADGALVVVQALRGKPADAADLIQLVCQAVTRDHGLAVAEVVLVTPAGVPRTTSGKVRRSACRDRYLAGELAVVAGGGRGGVPAGKEPDAVSLKHEVAEILGLSPETFDEDVPLSALGLDSLRAMQVQQLLTETAGVQPSLDDLLGGATLRELSTSDAETPVTGAYVEGQVTRGQQALWLLSQWNEGSAAAYVLARAVEMTPAPDEATLRDATERLLERHPQLRSRFRHDGVRVVREEWRVEDQDWFTVREASTDEDIAAEAARHVDLADDPLFRLVLFRRRGQSPVLLMVASHLVSDLHSFGVILADLGTLYGGTTLPRSAGMAPAVARENAYLASDEGGRTLRAWADELADAPGLALPRDRERAAGTRFRGGAELLRFSDADAAALDKIADEHNCTPYVVLLAAYHGFLDRICGQSDIVVGVPIALRSDPDVADAVGYLINTVPVRVDATDGGETLADRIALSRRAVRSVLSRSRVPLPSLVERLGVGSDPSPLFQVSCGFYENLAGLGLEVDGAVGSLGEFTLRSRPLPCRTAVTELDVTFGRLDGELVVRVNHSTEVFDPDTARHLAESLRTFVSESLAAPGEPLKDLPTWHGAASVVMPGVVEVGSESLAARFVHQLETGPDEPAMVHGDRTWTYAELGAWSGRAARKLPAVEGRTPVVALFFEGGPRFIVGMVAALRAGYAFMPLMPDLPDERLRFILADAGVSAVFAAPDDVDRVDKLLAEADVPAEVIALDENDGTDTRAELPVRDGRSVAYVVYTSGTTGRPKGVVITDDSVLPLLCWQAREFGSGPGMRMAQTCALSFDVGLQELLTVLVFGGAICLPLPGERYSAASFGNFLARDRANALYATPTFIRELTARDTPMHTIQVVQIAGEMLTSTVVERVRPLFGPGCRIYNGYGPTETSINCSMYLTSPGSAPEGAVLPVGTPTGLAQLYVLDRHRRPLPPMLHGEVYIGGPGVGAGYVNREEETAARFLPDTVTGSGRMYRTGDRGRVLTDGNLIIAGRLDDQVKIRGYRIEPSEVEAALRPLVADCAVLVAAGANGPRLLAFVTGDGANATALRLELAERLPAYMMPARIAVLDQLPRTRNGKLDTARLLALADRPDGTTQHTGRLLPVVVGVWRDVLGLAEVDVDANFFEIGGSSLLLAQVAASLKDATTFEVPVPKLLQYPTARSLSAYLENKNTARSNSAPSLGTARRVRGRQRRG